MHPFEYRIGRERLVEREIRYFGEQRGGCRGNRYGLGHQSRLAYRESVEGGRISCANDGSEYEIWDAGESIERIGDHVQLHVRTNQLISLRNT